MGRPRDARGHGWRILPGHDKAIITHSGARARARAQLVRLCVPGKFQTAFLGFWMQLVAHLRQQDYEELLKSFHIVTGTSGGGGRNRVGGDWRFAVFLNRTRRATQYSGRIIWPACCVFPVSHAMYPHMYAADRRSLMTDTNSMLTLKASREQHAQGQWYFFPPCYRVDLM